MALYQKEPDHLALAVSDTGQTPFLRHDKQALHVLFSSRPVIPDPSVWTGNAA